MVCKKEGRHLIKFSADILLFFSLLYLVLSIASTFSEIKAPAAAYANKSSPILVFSYGLSSLSLIASFLGLESVKEIVPFKYYRITGGLLMLLSLTALICILVKIHTFDLFALISLICGVIYIIGAYE